MTTQPVPIRQIHHLSDVVSEEVRALMGRHRVNQVKLAGVLGISQGQVSARLNGRTDFTLDDLQRLAIFFGVEPAALLGVAVAPTPVPPQGPPTAQPDALAELAARKRRNRRGGSTAEYVHAAA